MKIVQYNYFPYTKKCLKNKKLRGRAEKGEGKKTKKNPKKQKATFHTNTIIYTHIL